MEKKTPLYDQHIKAGGRIIPFAGYLLPVQYTGVIAEHMAVRHNAGLFDVSHMGEIMLQGGGALSALNMLLTNDYTNLAQGSARYSPMCNHRGGIIDDVIVYNVEPERYLIVVNASNREKDFNWILQNISGNVKAYDISDETAQIAIQGKRAKEILQKVTANIPQKRFTAIFDGKIDGISCHISRTGYTGEDGFEIYCNAGSAAKLWDVLLNAGKQEGLIPCGLGARDTLRFEASLPLYGHEMDEEITPLETGLGFFVKQDKSDFIGKEAMLKKNSGIRRIGLKLKDRGIAREGCDVYANGNKIGKTSSGTFCPFLGGAYAMALVGGDEFSNLEVDVRGKYLAAQKTDMPFYKSGA